MSSKEVAAIIVTHNRKELLVECLETLLTQSIPLGRIYVVDNASTDGTKELLSDKNFLSSPLIEYIHLDKNQGSSGGIYRGMFEALRAGFNWVWLMDDDAHPAYNCLQQLLYATQKHNFDLVGPIVIDKDNHHQLAFRLSKDICTVDDVRKNAVNGLISGTVNPYNGILVSAQAIEKIGFVKKEMFIWGDEVEYLLRAKKRGLTIASVVSAKLYHPRERGKYAMVLFGALGTVLLKPQNLRKIYYRNLGYIHATYDKAGLYKSLLKYTLYYIFNEKLNLSGLIQFYRYYFDGYTDKYTLR